MAGQDVATFGGGCFWCLEAVYARLQGVTGVESGYMGGSVPSPTYELVSTDTTGHAEVVQVVFDPSVLAYRDLLEVFFSIHDPTSLNRQGGDVGSQYRSVIFFRTARQEQEAREMIRILAGEFRWPILTQVQQASEFYRAEDYHQQYFCRHTSEPYCAIVVSPKIDKFRQQFAGRFKAE